jgi:PAS domain S-box-containing protein
MLHRKTHESQAANRALLAEVAEHQRTQGELRMLNFELEDRIAARTVELRDSEGRFRALAEEMPHLVWETQADGSGTFQNAKWRSYTGVSQIYQEDWRAIVHPEEVAAMLTAWEGSLQTGTECDTCCRLRRAADGSYRWFRIKAAPVRNHSGSIIRWVGTCTDVHEQRVAEEALVRADRRKDEFLAMLGHELRNPLAAIRHAIHLNNASENHAMREWANNVIARQTIQLSRMVDDLLDVARISRGRIELRLESLALDVILAQAIEAVRPSMNGKNHLFEYETPAEGFHVRGDAARLEQIFVNLLSNAVKYTPHGGRIVLSARRENDDVVISVSDNGIGIPPDILPYVFDLFTQGTTALDRAQGGLGIGLTVVRSLTEMHGGRVKAESGGRITGAIFTVWLPLLPKEELPVETVGTKSTADKLRKSLRVLIVDDHVDAAQTLALLFTHRNCDVRIAHDGPSGIAAAKEFLPEVLLLDLGLPGVDGYQVASSLRSEPKLRDALFIAISGYAQEADRERSLAAGFDHHCAKPIEFSSLIALIDADSPHPESATH